MKKILPLAVVLFMLITPQVVKAEGSKIYLGFTGKNVDMEQLHHPVCNTETPTPTPSHTPCPCPPPATPTRVHPTNTPTSSPTHTQPTYTPTSHPSNTPTSQPPPPTPMACSDPVDLYEPLVGTLDQWGQRVIAGGGADHLIGLGGQVVDNSVYDQADLVVLNTYALHDHGWVSDRGCVLAYVCAPVGGIRIRATAWDGRFFIVPFEAGITLNQGIAAMRVTLESAHQCRGKVVFHELVRHGDPVALNWMEKLFGTQYKMLFGQLDPWIKDVTVPNSW